MILADGGHIPPTYRDPVEMIQVARKDSYVMRLFGIESDRSARLSGYDLVFRARLLFRMESESDRSAKLP